MISSILILILFSILFLTLWKRKSEKIPPGPKNLPLLGSMPFLTLKNGILDWVLDEIITKNKITTINFGFFLKVFIINDYDLAKVLEIANCTSFAQDNLPDIRKFLSCLI